MIFSADQGVKCCNECAYSSQKNGLNLGGTKASFLGGKRLRQGKWVAPTSRRAVTVSAVASERPLWFPGSVPPPWLDGR